MERTDESTSIFGPPAERVAEVAVEKSEDVVMETVMKTAPGGGREIVTGGPWASGQAVGVARDDDSLAKVLDAASAGDGSSSNGCDLDNAAEEEVKDCHSESNHLVRRCEPVGCSEDDLPPKILAVAGTGDASRSNDSNFGDAADYEGKDCFTESNHTVITLRQCGQGHQRSRKRVSRNCRNGARGFDSVFMSVVRRKRGSLSKRGCASVWGLLGNVAQFCTVSNGPGKVEGRNAGSGSTHIRLKVKVGKEAKPSSLNVADSGLVCASESDGAAVNNSRMESLQGTSSEALTLLLDGGEEEGGEIQLPPLEDKTEKAKSSSDGSIKDVNPTNKDSEGTVVSSLTAGDADLRASSPVELEAFGAAAEKSDTDPATSPDSVVSIFVPEGELGTKGNAAKTNKVKPLKKCGGGLKGADDSCTYEIAASSASANVSSNSSSSKEFSVEQIPLSTETEIEVSEDASKGESGVEAQICGNLDGGDPRASELPNVESPVLTTKSKGHPHPRKSDGVSKRRPVTPASRSRQRNGNRKKGNERKSIDRNKAKERSGCGHVHKKDHSETDNCNANEIGEFDCGDCNTLTNVAGLSVASNAMTQQCLRVDNAWVRCDDCLKWRRISEELADSIGQTNCRWICVENIDKAFADCSTPQEMSNAEINAELGISDADEEAFDVFSNSMMPECNRITASKEQEFMRISTNQFLHRSRKTQTIDEIMVCGCKVPLDGGLGCRDGCLNRVLNIECIPETCPCGDLCSNQQFQKLSYAKMKWDRCGKKGFGLRLEEDILRGQFLIEYVGEVLDICTYQARLKEYASMGHKHFYFMTLDGSEVIDACAKGNLGRFINHSCDPNCRTEKWVVNGEICIGLFALRDIKKGEEVTFDYNYVRVVGAAAKKCYCGSHHCRGYIGGDPTNTEVIDQVDSDEEFPEPVMLEEGESQNRLKDSITRASYFDGVEMASFTRAVVEPEIASEVEDSMDQTAAVVSQLHKSLDVSDLKRSSYSSQPAEVPLQVEDVSSKPISAVQPDTSVEETMGKTSSAIQMSEVPPTTVQSKVSPDCIVASKKSKSTTSGEKRVFVKSRFYIKTSGQSGSVKKGKHSADQSNTRRVQIMANRSDMVSWRPKKLMEVVANGRFETVEEKLNELLDADGGISKRKDSPRGYLQLLHLTAASGSSGNGETIQSNRDLSMILDAILKTKSRMVLTDIIHKNVLQKLHNMMKQCRRDFKKMPILRKVLKVLEYLAIRGVLKLEHICKGPPHPGAESYIESILSLTEHDDKQVHQIARSFRDRWIPRHARKICFLDRDEERKNFSGGANSNMMSASHNGCHDQGIRPTEQMDAIIQPELPTTSVDTSVHESSSISCIGGGTGVRKRKSRWDQDKPVLKSVCHYEQKVDSGLLQQSEFEKFGNIAGELLDQAATCIDNRKQNMHEDVPPGFLSPPSKPMSSVSLLNATDMPRQNSPLDGLVVGYPHKKFISHLAVSYGIPLPIVQQFGSPQAEYVDSWVIAPGMAFHPFPPLPPGLHPNKEASSCSVNS